MQEINVIEMNFREAQIKDIPQIQIVRNAVKENTLSNPNLVTDEDCETFLTLRGKGWVCEIDHSIAGFSIVDLQDNNIWALFIHPSFEKQGIGWQLHDKMLDWYFKQTKRSVWLGTSPQTRAENFYRKAGWIEIGKHGVDEIKFEMTYAGWMKMKRNREPVTIPKEGENPENILAQIDTMKQEDVEWKEGRAWSLVYYVDDVHDKLLQAASSKLFSANYLNPLAFKSLHKMEQEVVHMTSGMLHGNTENVGVMTSGGTESIMLALFCYRQRAKKLHPKITLPEVVAPITIHPAFDKAAVYFGLLIRKVPVDENRCASPAAMEKLINENTILIAASAPSYPNGVMDPIADIAAIANRHKLPFHVDACVGGFMLPWIEKLGYPIPPWDFRIAGVTSISADVHKLGYGAKGASVLVYKSMDYLRHQFMVTTDFPGGIYISPTLLGTRSGGPIAAAWAGMKHLGENGYLTLAQKLMDGAETLRKGLEALPNIKVIGTPCMNLISYATYGNKADIFVIADKLEEKGWMAERQQFPDCIHLTVLPTNVQVIDAYLNDLKEALSFASAHPEATAQGNAAIYGMMARIPFRGMVEKSVKKIMEDMYENVQTKPMVSGESANSALAKNPAWMGWANRWLAAFTRWKGKKAK
jgi:sphinganine-1-phosphate aldolase